MKFMFIYCLVTMKLISSKNLFTTCQNCWNTPCTTLPKGTFARTSSLFRDVCLRKLVFLICFNCLWIQWLHSNLLSYYKRVEGIIKNTEKINQLPECWCGYYIPLAINTAIQVLKRYFKILNPKNHCNGIQEMANNYSRKYNKPW